MARTKPTAVWGVFPCIPLCTPSSVSLSYIIIEIFLHRKLNIFTPLFDCFCTILYEFYTIGFFVLAVRDGVDLSSCSTF